jgi:hypothetical protein
MALAFAAMLGAVAYAGWVVIHDLRELEEDQ